MSDIASTFFWLIGAALTGAAAGSLCKHGSQLVVEIMLRMEADSTRLAHLREMNLLRQRGILRFQTRTEELTAAVRAKKHVLDEIKGTVRALERDLTTVKDRPEVVWRMVGDERNGSRCFCADVANANIARADARENRSNWLPRDWRRRVLSVVWADSIGEARAKLESTYQHGDGFRIGRVSEFFGVAGVPE